MQNFQTLKRSLGAAAAMGLLTVQQAYAELPAAATASMEEGKADSMTLGGLALAIIIAIVALKYARRAL